MVQSVFEGAAPYEYPEIGLRVKLDGKWLAGEFSELLEGLRFLNDVARLKHDETGISQGHRYIHILPWLDRYGPYHRRFGDLHFDFEEESAYIRRQVRSFANESTPEGRDELRILRIALASPGHLDLVGFGKIAKEVRIFLEGIFDRFSEDRKIERDLNRQKVIAAKIANANKLLALGDKVDLPPSDRQAIVREVLSIDRFIETKVIGSKITDVEPIRD